jgi:hypothetical protein
MQYLGVIRGAGTLGADDGNIFGRVEYDIDGFLTQAREVVASGELPMSADDQNNAFGRNDLRLRTDDGRTLHVRFSGKRLNPASGAAHVDVSGELPTAKQWRR